MKDRLSYLSSVHMLPVRVSFGVLIIAALSLPARGDTIAPSLFSFAGQEVNSPTFTGNHSSSGAFVEDTGTTSISGGTFSYDAFASAVYGEFKGYSSSNSTAMTSPQSTGAGTDSQFTDIMTVDYAPLTGLQGLMQINYALDGTSSTDGVGGAGATVIVSVSNGAGFVGASGGVSQVYNGAVSGIFSVPNLVAFTYGTPFNLDFQMLTGAGTFTEAGGSTSLLPTTLAASDTSDFSNTLVLSGLITFDAEGNPTPLATFTSGSGTAYTQDGIVTPEPSVLLLLASGIAGILATRARNALISPIRR